MVSKTLIVATSNPGKLQEMQEHLRAVTGWQLQLKPQELDIEETGDSFITNARLKAMEVAKALGEYAIADDSGLMVDALGGAPGIYSARYADTDANRIARILRELGNNKNRQAQFVCAVAIASPEGKIILETEGICKGEILTQPLGTGGFGYDPIFWVPEVGETFAQMSPEVKRAISHRGVAFAQILPELDRLGMG